MVLFECTLCKYTTELKANYNRHIKSSKHINKLDSMPSTHISSKAIKKQHFGNKKQHFGNKKQHFGNKKQHLVDKNEYSIDTIQHDKPFECKYCDKHFSHRQSLATHVKYSCKKNDDEDLKELVRLLNLQLEQQRTETEQYKADSVKKDKQLENQQKQIDKLMDKLQVPQVTNNIQYNNIRLSYKDTDVSHLTDADYRKSINCLLMCVKTFIGIVHLDPNHPENMNIYISNLKDKYIMVYTGETWELKNRQYEMNSLYDHNEMLLSEWVKEHGNHDLQDKFKTYLERKENSLEMIHEEIRLMLYNKRHLAICE
jgi:hypothetical protein